jgi:hypothetical protein
MPILFWIVGGISSLVSGVFGFILGGGVSGFSRLLIWGVIGFVSYIGARHFKVI